MGDGSTTEFNFNFPFYENTNIIVTVNGTNATGYSVIGTQGGDNADIPFIGGKVIFDVAPISTDSITISRSLPLTRIVDYQPTEKINPTILNQDQNYTMEVLKDFNDKLDAIDEKYSEIINTESTQILINKINEFLRQLQILDNSTQAIGGIPGIGSNILNLNNQTAELPNKLNKTLDNLPDASKQNIVSLCMPDYNHQIVGTTTAPGTYITCERDSFVVVWGHDPYSENYSVTVKTPNENIVCVGQRYDDTNANTEINSFTFLCPKNHSFTCDAEQGFEYRILTITGAY